MAVIPSKRVRIISGGMIDAIHRGLKKKMHSFEHKFCGKVYVFISSECSVVSRHIIGAQ